MEGIRIHLDGKWTVEDFGKFFDSISEIVKTASELRNDRLGLSVSAGDLPKPSVHAIVFSSPGHIDIVGLGKVMGEVRQLIVDIIELVSTKHDRKQKRQLTQLEIASAALEVQSKLMDSIERLADADEKGNLPDSVLWSQRFLLEKIGDLTKAAAEGRITKASG